MPEGLFDFIPARMTTLYRGLVFGLMVLFPADSLHGQPANRLPVALLNGTLGESPVLIHARAGQQLYLSAEGSHDPDPRDVVTFCWRVRQEDGTYEGEVVLEEETAEQALLRIPDDAGGHEIHVILEVKDDGHPVRRSYRRAVIKVSQEE